MEQVEEDADIQFAEELDGQVSSVLEHAVDAHQRDLKVYQSLQNLNEVIGTEYGDRVLYELIQNAHDAHRSGGDGQIAIHLVIHSDSEGVLYIANGGDGFRSKDVEAIRNLAISAKEVGEGIGNKGLGFRSIEAITNDVRIFSRRGPGPSDRFDGYCFRFAEASEIEGILQAKGYDAITSEAVARTIPRYLIPRPVLDQPEEISRYARRGYATVIAAPLRTEEAVALVSSQVEALASSDTPLMLFLDRISEIRIDVERPGQEADRRRLYRRQSELGGVLSRPRTRMFQVDVGEGQSFLVVRRVVEKERVLDAVRGSLQAAPQLKRWLNWEGEPVVSVAVGLSQAAVAKGCLYNFLPMGEKAPSPLIGYLDAPFFADIDRRSANLGLPLNSMLMTAAAETCVAAALTLSGSDIPMPEHVVFDLIAWTGNEAGKIKDAFKEVGSSLVDARVIPATADKGMRAWSSLAEIKIWPNGPFSVLKGGEVAKHVGAQLVSNKLDHIRIERLKEIAERNYQRLNASGVILAKWAAAFAQKLTARKVSHRIWTGYYNDLPQVFEASGADLKCLNGKAIIYDQKGRLRPAGGHDDETLPGAYVRSDPARGGKKKTRAPLLPYKLARRYCFLNEKVHLQHETLEAFIKAGLVKKYDPVEALVGLKSAMGKTAKPERWEQALVWAFRAWQAAGGPFEEELPTAGLHVPTPSGWQPTVNVSFSSSWTPIGKTLENFLIEAAEYSQDCRLAHDLLLVNTQQWPEPVQDEKKTWVRFLKLIGVADGLRPVPAQLKCRGTPSGLWQRLIWSGNDAEGLDKDWCLEVANISFSHPYTDYEMKGEASRLPGQIENDSLPGNAREAFCDLVFKYLKANGTDHFQFEVGRFDRYVRDWDTRKLPTPLATFLRSKSWLAAATEEGLTFRRPGDCWGARVRRGGPPKFVLRIPESIVDFSEDDVLADLVFSSDLGLRDWQNRTTAIARLCDLANLAEGLSGSERAKFWPEYRGAWQDLLETEMTLPGTLSLAVTRRGQLERLSGNPDSPPSVIVTEDAQRFDARMLSSAGLAVLEVGPVAIERIVALLADTGAFSARRLDGIGRLLVDGEPFFPQESDPLLGEVGLDWLPEIIVIGHELLGEQLERGIQRATIDRRARAIRVRRCKTITLVVDNVEVSPHEPLQWYAFEHEELPTLIVTHGLTLNWKTLASKLSGGLSRLIDARLRSLERLLLRLCVEQAEDGVLAAPSDEALAHALGCGVQTIQDHRAALRTDLEHILHLLIPVVAYSGGVALARQFQADADRAGTKFDMRNWLESHIRGQDQSPDLLIEACEHAGNRAELRKQLDLDYERFNGALVDLGEVPLSNEGELRRVYEAYLGQMRPKILDRLRRYHAGDFHEGHDLSLYVERKSLSFLEFNPGWILTRDTLTPDEVEKHVSALLAEALGDDTVVELGTFKSVIDTNRKLVGKFVMEAMPIVSVWCRQNEVLLPQPWQQGEAQTVVWHLEDKGLLDFVLLEPWALPTFCDRAGCWPDGMPEALDGNVLGLSKGDVEVEQRLRENERQKLEIERRSIQFAGQELDTGDPKYIGQLQGLAGEYLARDESWFERSRKRIRLVEFESSGQPSAGAGGGGKHGGERRRERQLTEPQRQAMGFAGEWLAFEYLRRRHPDFVDETCWVSSNRARVFGGDKGDDTAGFDFRVKTPKADWLYEVKSTMEDGGEFELTANEMRVASRASKDSSRRYRILYVPYVLSPDKWYVLELPNPMGEATRNRFKTVGRGSVRLRFERE